MDENASKVVPVLGETVESAPQERRNYPDSHADLAGCGSETDWDIPDATLIPNRNPAIADRSEVFPSVFPFLNLFFFFPFFLIFSFFFVLFVFFIFSFFPISSVSVFSFFQFYQFFHVFFFSFV